MRKIFFDLDGTLIDSSERLYKLFNDLVVASKFSKSQYWELKRNKINHKMILEKYFPDLDFDKFNNIWLENIEKMEYLALDKLKESTLEVLKKLSDEFELYIVTARQNKENLVKEINLLQINQFFENILVTESKYSKEDLIRKNCQISPYDILIGDTGFDIKTGKALSIKTCAITDGFLSKESLQNYSPDYMIDDLKELLIGNIL